MERSTIFVGSPGFDAFADALRAASAKAISRSLPPDETIKIINAELEGYEPGERIGAEIDQDHVPEFPVRDDASVEDDTMLFGEKPLLQPLNAGIKSDTSVAQVLVSGPKSISPSSKHASDEIEYHPSGPHVKFASDDVAATFMGPWFGGAGGLGVRLDGVGRIRFTRPVVVRSIKGIGEKQLYVFGKRGSSESWRRIIRSEQSHFECDTGDVVWIKSRKDGRRHVAKVVWVSLCRR
ncbi:hypothetical protein Pmar_PMAR019910 [Perkinsus marinus ATCC 50983]|uniref:Uncharacterized protein n=1 Tax=Perkinsus marinus (strain ATCC 50983 / TXsc) TaxID=423536 RepID=C5KBZ6_PERM5|nr:hypothetical protein Pmar_PMAR019910 [Perkinsus marinus ATCC 50983]EER18027.1 hypothetical protein Pmar_PMAR019910 [Perkinsus marinus ATCC 50983]|eukprot:XP_002786231.1 hypothetical protein Pmar_PMAR019910 [Perkinsus marinus ATCC 50983]